MTERKTIQRVYKNEKGEVGLSLRISASGLDIEPALAKIDELMTKEGYKK